MQLLLLICIALVSLFIIGTLGTLIVTATTGIRLEALGDMSKWDYTDPRVLNFLRGNQVVQFISLFLIPVFICARLFSTDSKKYLGLIKPAKAGYLIAGIGIMILSVPLISWLGELNRHIQFPSGIEGWMREKEEDAAKITQAFLSGQTIKDLLLNIVCIAGMAAVGEELLFRGIAQRLFIKIFKNPWVGIVIAAFLFSAMHVQFYGFLPRFVLGIFLGIIYWYSGSLWTAILAHFVYDATIIVLSYFKPEMIADETSMDVSNLALVASISFVIVVLLIGWMKRKSTTTYSEVYAEDDIPV